MRYQLNDCVILKNQAPGYYYQVVRIATPEENQELGYIFWTKKLQHYLLREYFEDNFNDYTIWKDEAQILTTCQDVQLLGISDNLEQTKLSLIKIPYSNYPKLQLGELVKVTIPGHTHKVFKVNEISNELLNHRLRSYGKDDDIPHYLLINTADQSDYWWFKHTEIDHPNKINTTQKEHAAGTE